MYHSVIIIVLVAIAITLWMVFSLPYSEMKAYVNGLAPDGNVETFTLERYASSQFKAKVVALVSGLTAVVVLFSKQRRKRSDENRPGFSGFIGDWNHTVHKILKRTSKLHLIAVGAIIAVGAVLRGILLFEPVIYDEAFTYTYFASRPFFVAMSDYSYPNNHILHTLLIKISTGLLGVGHVQLRLPAFIAGVLCLPAFYIFIRSMFNRYIALMALALVAGTGGLIEYSALARGYSITWLSMLVALMLMRHLIRSNNSVTAVLLGVVNAIGMWAVPTMIYMSIFVYLTCVLLLLSKYETTLKDRIQKLLLSVVVFIICTLIFYSPVVIMHSVDQLFHHPTMGENSWEGLKASTADRLAEIMVYWSYTTNPIITFLGILSLLFAGFVSSKFRVLLFSTVLGIVPLVILQGMIGPARIWNFVQFIYCTAIAIALFYALKFVQEKVFSGFHKRARTIIASALLLLLFGGLAMPKVPERYNRYSEAMAVADSLKHSWTKGDGIMADFPWKAPLQYYLIANVTGASGMFEESYSGQAIFLVVSPSSGQTIKSVLGHHNLKEESVSDIKKLIDARQCELYSARLK